MNLVKKDFICNTDLLSEEYFKEHMVLYENYIKNVNNFNTKMANRNQIDLNEFYTLKQQEAFNLDSVLLHEMYFENIQKGGYDSSTAINVFNKPYGGFSEWKDDFIKCAKISKGWVCFGYHRPTDTYRNIILNAHDQNILFGFEIIICLDVYEHSYWGDYGADKSKYIDNFLDNINWGVVEQRLKSIQ